MNRQAFRLIFSKRLSALVPVAEFVSRTGKSAGEGAGDGIAGGMAFVRPALGFGCPGLRRLAACMAFALGTLPGVSLADLPTGGAVSVGSGTINVNGQVMTIEQATQRMGINWQTYNIGAGQRVRYLQPNADAVALNRVTGNSRSEIYGALEANGRVFLINPNGILFGRTAEINVGGLLATTRNIADADFAAGRYQFTGSSSGEIINQGNLKATDGGSIVLAAQQVRNEGNISTQGGRVVMAAGERVALTLDSGNQLTVKVDGETLNALVENKGLITADGGSVWLTAKGKDLALDSAINMSGVITAHGGTVVLDGGDSGVTQVNGGTIDVSGKETTPSAVASTPPQEGNGGTVILTGQYIGVLNSATINASGANGGGRVIVGGDLLGKVAEIKTDIRVADETVFDGTSKIDISSSQGDGGFVETSGKRVRIEGAMVAHSALKAGQWLIDPNDILIKNAPSSGLSSTAGVWEGENTTGTSIVNNMALGNALNTGASIELRTHGSGNITVANAITAAGAGNLTLNAGANINIAAAIKLANITAGTLTLIGKNISSTAAGSINTSTGLTFIASGNAGIISGVISGSGYLIKTGSGCVTLANTNTYTGQTSIKMGTLNVQASKALGSAAVSVIDGATLGLSQKSSGSYQLTNSITLNNGTIYSIYANKDGVGNNLSGAITIVGTNNLIKTAYDTRHLTLSGGLAGSGDLTLTQNTNSYKGGIIRLTGAGSYNGTVSITGQARSSYPVDIINANALQYATVNMGVNGFLRISGDVSIGALMGNAGNIFTNGTLSNLTLNSTRTYNFGGAIGLSGNAAANRINLVKKGAGTQILTGENFYTGITTVAAGTLQIGNGGTTGVIGSGDIINNANFVFNRSNGVLIDNVVSGSGNVTLLGAGIQIANHFNIAGILNVSSQGSFYNNNNLIRAGSIQINTGLDVLSGDLTGTYLNGGTLAATDGNLSLNGRTMVAANSTLKASAQIIFNGTVSGGAMVFTDVGRWKYEVTDPDASYLLVGGGGGGGAGGGWSAAGGGGAGELVLGCLSGMMEAGAVYDVEVGAGGLGSANGTTFNNGGRSMMGGVTALGGGAGGNSALISGGSSARAVGRTGGSGGGSAADNNRPVAAGAGQADDDDLGMGNDGGAIVACGTFRAGAGGGGAGGAGGSITKDGPGGNGGEGVLSAITGVELYYAGGGGGGSRTTGGGGTSSTGGRGGGGGQTGASARANSGGGGGGGGASTNANVYKGGDGGSGIVIIRNRQPANLTLTANQVVFKSDIAPNSNNSLNHIDITAAHTTIESTGGILVNSPVLGCTSLTIAAAGVQLARDINISGYLQVQSRGSFYTNANAITAGEISISTGAYTDASPKAAYLNGGSLTANSGNINFLKKVFITADTVIAAQNNVTFNDTVESGAMVFTDVGRWKYEVTDPDASYLLVGGGGGGGAGGGWSAAGGGGAGELVLGCLSGMMEAGAVYDVEVGAGGLGSANGTTFNNGGRSMMGGVTALGGGAGGNSALISGGSSARAVGRTGGSGGGSAADNNRPVAAGAGQADDDDLGMGNDGGAIVACGTFRAGAGGGGAGGAGGSITKDGPGGNGGEGVLSAITGVELYYAGGGGGGSRTTGGGGTSSTGGRGGGGGQTGASARANSGGGGGGGGASTNANVYKGGDGGSGIVIIRNRQPANLTLTAKNVVFGGTVSANTNNLLNTLTINNANVSGAGVINAQHIVSYQSNEKNIWSAVLGGDSSFSKTGYGTTILTALNTYTGQTTIEGGTLQVGHGGSSASLGLGDVLNNATLIFNQSADIYVTNNITNNGQLTVLSQAGALEIGGNLLNHGHVNLTAQGNLTITGQLSNARDMILNSVAGDIVAHKVLYNDGVLRWDLGSKAQAYGQIQGDGATTVYGKDDLVLGGSIAQAGAVQIHSDAQLTLGTLEQEGAMYVIRGSEVTASALGDLRLYASQLMASAGDVRVAAGAGRSAADASGGDIFVEAGSRAQASGTISLYTGGNGLSDPYAFDALRSLYYGENTGALHYNSAYSAAIKEDTGSLYNVFLRRQALVDVHEVRSNVTTKVYDGTHGGFSIDLNLSLSDDHSAGDRLRDMITTVEINAPDSHAGNYTASYSLPDHTIVNDHFTAGVFGYALDSEAPSLVPLTIERRDVRVAVSGEDKVFDTTDAIRTSYAYEAAAQGSNTGLLAEDAQHFGLSYKAAFTQAMAGENVAFGLSDLYVTRSESPGALSDYRIYLADSHTQTVLAPDVTDHSIPVIAQAGTARITPAVVSISHNGTVYDKTYDTTTNARIQESARFVVAYGDGSAGSETRSIHVGADGLWDDIDADLASGLHVNAPLINVAATLAYFEQAGAGRHQVDVTYSLQDTVNYTFAGNVPTDQSTVRTTATIHKAAVTLTQAQAANKIYDGHTGAALQPGSLAWDIALGDSVQADGSTRYISDAQNQAQWNSVVCATAQNGSVFNQAAAGERLTAQLSIALADSANYSFSAQADVPTTIHESQATIERRTLTVSGRTQIILEGDTHVTPFTYSGLLPGESLESIGVLVQGDWSTLGAGAYSIWPQVTGIPSNYTVRIEAGSLTVLPLPGGTSDSAVQGLAQAINSAPMFQTRSAQERATAIALAVVNVQEQLKPSPVAPPIRQMLIAPGTSNTPALSARPIEYDDVQTNKAKYFLPFFTENGVRLRENRSGIRLLDWGLRLPFFPLTAMLDEPNRGQDEMPALAWMHSPTSAGP